MTSKVASNFHKIPDCSRIVLAMCEIDKPTREVRRVDEAKDLDGLDLEQGQKTAGHF